MKRPFWMHQLAEYILALALVGVGIQSPTPAMACVMGGLLLVYAASTKSAVAAFRLIPRRVHKVADPLMAAAIVLGALQPWVTVEDSTKVLMIAVAAVYLFVWWQSRYDEKVKAPPAERSGDRATDLGRSAGRLVGGGVKAVRRARAQRDDG